MPKYQSDYKFINNSTEKREEVANSKLNFSHSFLLTISAPI